MIEQKKITIPYNFCPRWYQLPFLATDKRFKIAVIHRRAGKSMTALNDQIAKTQKKVGTYYYFLPTYRQAKAVIWDSLIRNHVPNHPQLISKINESELAIYYKNGSIQRFAGCDDPDKHRGINPIDVVFDEYAEMDPTIWEAIVQPILAQNGGSATFIFTPRGKNHAFQLLQYAKANPDRWFQTVISVTDTDAIPAEELEEVRKSTPQALYAQEYLCEFNDNAGAFFRRITPNVHHDSLEYNPLHTYRMGVDLAMYNDYTVITILDLNTFKVHKQVRFNQIDWNLQKARIEALYHRFGCPEVVIDATGVGSPIALDLEAAGINIMPFKFSAASKAPLLSHLAVLLEQDKIKIPNDPILIAEMESVTCGMSDKGKITINTPRNMHDDTVMSLALACHGISDKIYSDDGESDEWLLKQQQASSTTTDTDDLYNGI